MSDELKPCPFCGKLPRVDRDMCWCNNLTCSIYNKEIYTRLWNYRPIEDTLRKQLDVAKEAIAELQYKNSRLKDYEELYHRRGDINGPLVAERNAISAEFDGYKYFHPRAMKLLMKRKAFLVVALDEPYYRQVYDLIRDNEMLKGTWTIEDENHYIDALAKIEKIGNTK